MIKGLQRPLYSLFGLIIFNPLMFIKSLSLSVIKTRLCTIAVAAIMASGVFAFFLRRISTQWEIIAVFIFKIVLSAIKDKTFSSVFGDVFQQSNSIWVITDKLIYDIVSKNWIACKGN